jgi:hypothetical protein
MNRAAAALIGSLEQVAALILCAKLRKLLLVKVCREKNAFCVLPPRCHKDLNNVITVTFI